ncbi:hypothetical protein [Bartonella sp. CL100XZDX]|uniref:hypothetical protein n=1 Tax=Bartonella sp. CL100XZDX TaxID=3243515 RepID=UPI0035CF6A72
MKCVKIGMEEWRARWCHGGGVSFRSCHCFTAWEEGIDCFSHFTLISGGKGLLAMNRLMIGL